MEYPLIESVTPLPDRRLQLKLSTGSILELNMKNRMETVRYYPLQDDAVFDSVVTDGYSLLFSKNGHRKLEFNLREAVLMALNPPPNTHSGFNPFRNGSTAKKGE